VNDLIPRLKEFWDRLNPAEPDVGYLVKLYAFAALVFAVAILVGRLL
jgi:hypothetical protein